MNIQQPLISVIVPTYNRAHLIKAAIDSVLKQTYTNFELLIVDDHSTDNTKEIVEQYEDERVKYLVNTRTKGAQGARNTGLFSANGDWIAMLDSDDFWLPDKLKKQVEYIQSCTSDIVGLTTGTATYNFKDKIVVDTKIPGKSAYSTEQLLYKNYLMRGFSALMFNRETALKAGGFDEAFPAMQDMDFYISLSMRGEIHVLREVLVYVRTTNKDRISTDYKKKLIAAKTLNQKYKSLGERDRLQSANRYGRIVYYSILSNQPYSIDFLKLFILLFKDFRHLMSILKVFIKQKLYGRNT